ncbi:twin-arginine translocation signal domain-containing protein [Marinicauda algicola]|uniref:Twin-arginine translocation signal domain-containing protein n=1 Tax=Marinicauda algicola TaxID=2029849 RepID=A0A4S2H3Q8_9PROT|nr:protocatechuate 3,4-dioxygenase [Marinicauda algicola]TGY90001.1 twin-arginine translocation signal domain-containing protein [Marinicauda algicola]
MGRTNLSRRGFMVAGATAGAGVLGGAAQGNPVATPAQTEGPFYPTVEQSDKDADLTRVAGRDTVAAGEIIEVEGRVLSAQGEPIAGAVVDIWQANSAGRYAHEADPNPAPLDPNFQGWAILTTDAQGRYRFRTVKPGAYPVDESWSRPPHVHFKVARRGFREITTQMYFEGEPLNEVDRVLNSVSEPERSALVARRAGDSGVYTFDVVLVPV